MAITINAITPTVGVEITGMTADQLVEPRPPRIRSGHSMNTASWFTARST